MTPFLRSEKGAPKTLQSKNPVILSGNAVFSEASETIRL